MTAIEETTVAETGIVLDVPEELYHADTTALSASAAKVLLRSPARRFQWRQENPEGPKAAFDLGTTGHTLILGTGSPAWIIDADAWTSPKVRDQRDAARSYGFTPILRHQYEAAKAMADAVLNHEWSIDGAPVGTVGGTLLSGGDAEVSLWWEDPDTGARCRGRIDYLHPNAIVDVKTTSREDGGGLTAFAKQCADMGYRESMAHYRNGVRVLTGRTLPVFLIVVEVEPPHLVAVYTLSDEDLAWGSERMREAQEIWLRCVESGEWPAYPSDLQTLTFPHWAY